MPRGINQYDEARLQGRLWTPTDSSSPIWFDPLILSSLIFTGSNITTVNNLSNNGFNLTAGSCRYDSTYNGFLFNGTSESIASITTRALGADFAIVCELNPASLTQVGICAPIDWEHSTYPYGPMVVQTESADTDFYFAYSNGTTFYAYSPTPPKMGVLPINQWSLCTMFVVNGSSFYYLNGSLVSGYPRTELGSVSTSSRKFMLGGAFNFSRFFNGRIGSVRIFTSPSLLETQKEEGRVAWRRAYLTGNQDLLNKLPASHPFRNRPPLIGD